MPAYGPRVSERAGWVDQLRDAAKHALLVVALAALPLLGSPHTAYAENELAAQCGGKFDSSLIDRQCFASSCKAQTQACLENSECMKGLVCTARCLGDTKCISGCFARFGNADIDGLIQCSIEDNACLKVAILQPGPEDPAQAPPPPVPVLKDFQPKSLEGRWYKVMGWNSMYDCYDCQLNKFATIAAAAPAPAPAGGAQASPRTTAFDAATSGMSVQRADEALQQLAERPSSAMQVDVDFDMPRPATLLRSGHNHQHLRERLDFDAPGSARTAHTHGSMFGLSFWENWYLLGENARGEPQFKFVYYNGRTVQNKYDGAFVYARTPDVPAEALPSIYRVLREAGFEPESFCRVRNSCGVPSQLGPELIGVPGVLADEPSGPARALVDGVSPLLPQNPLVLSSLQIWYELTDYLEDPHYAGSYILQNQERMPPLAQFATAAAAGAANAGDAGAR